MEILPYPFARHGPKAHASTVTTFDKPWRNNQPRLKFKRGKHTHKTEPNQSSLCTAHSAQDKRFACYHTTRIILSQHATSTNNKTTRRLRAVVTTALSLTPKSSKNKTTTRQNHRHYDSSIPRGNPPTESSQRDPARATRARALQINRTKSRAHVCPCSPTITNRATKTHTHPQKKNIPKAPVRGEAVTNETNAPEPRWYALW